MEYKDKLSVKTASPFDKQAIMETIKKLKEKQANNPIPTQKTTEKSPFEKSLELLTIHGIQPPQKVVGRLNIPHARQVLYETLKGIVELENKRFQWLPEYEEVADWLANDKGKSLFLFGNCGRGKTLITKYALPMILLEYKAIALRPYNIQEMAKNVDEILTRKYIGLDDIGTETITNSYGTKREVFAEIIDHVEKTKALAVISSNLGKNELKNRYGERVYERISNTCVRIPFNGNSLRG